MPPVHALPIRKRLNVLLISIGFILFHLTISNRLSRLSTELASTLGNQSGDESDFEGGEFRRLYGIVTLVRIGRLWSLCSAGIAATGLYSIYKSNLPLLRLFALNSFLSIGLDVLLLLLALLLVVASSTSSSSSRSIATTLCQILSNSSSPRSDDDAAGWWGLSDLLGLSLEACEERFDGVVLTATIALSCVEIVRGWAAIQLLGYYTMAAKLRNGLSVVDTATLGGGGGGTSPSSRRKGGLRLDTTNTVDQERYYDSPVELEGTPATTSSSSSSSKGKHRERESSSSSSKREDTRIFLLPKDVRSKGREGGGDDGVPLLSLTPSSPARMSFPPTQSSRESSSKHVLVYAPVMMTAEEARQYGASELLLHSSPPGSGSSSRRTRSHSSSTLPSSSGASRSSHSHHHLHHHGSSSSSAGGSRRSRSSTITPGSAPVTSTSPSSSSPLVPSSSSSSTLSSSTSTTTTKPPPSSSSSRSPLSLTPPTNRISRHDSDDLPTPTTNATRIGIAGVLRGDLEEFETVHHKKA